MEVITAGRFALSAGIGLQSLTDSMAFVGKMTGIATYTALLGTISRFMALLSGPGDVLS